MHCVHHMHASMEHCPMYWEASLQREERVTNVCGEEEGQADVPAPCVHEVVVRIRDREVCETYRHGTIHVLITWMPAATAPALHLTRYENGKPAQPIHRGRCCVCAFTW
jgi:hypothetical protein